MVRKRQKAPPVILSIAGYDPSSGAGIAADIKTISAHGCYGVTCITALTVQSTLGVERVVPVTGKLVSETLKALASDVEIAAVKIGMLDSADAARAVVGFLRQSRPAIVVIDPVIRSSSGTDLISADAMRVLQTRLLPLATVITPNIAEAAALTGLKVQSRQEMLAAAEHLQSMGPASVIITGGHLRRPADLVSEMAKRPVFLNGRRIKSSSSHGTGCVFSTALTCNLAHGLTVGQAARRAKSFVRAALRQPPGIGKGTGPII